MRFRWILGACAISCCFVGVAEAARDDLVMGMTLEPPHLDPTAGAAAAIDEIVYANVFEGLTRIGPDGQPQPALAESWSVSEDGLVWDFALRRGVTFHDGAEFDSSDVVFAFERAMADDSVNAQKALFEPIESVEATGPHGVRLTLARPTGQLLFSLGWGDAVIVDPASAETNKANPIGTGPFAFVEWRKGDSVTLERADGYWGEPASLARATFRFIGDPSAASSAMLAGDVDAFANFPAPEALSLLEDDPQFEVVIGSTEGETILAMNNGAPPLDDVRVRRAIAAAIDRDVVIEGAMLGYGTPIGSHFAPHHPAYVDLIGTNAFDPEKARALLAEAGVGEGLALTLKLPPPTYARRGGELIAAQLAQIGVEVEIVPVEWAQWLEQVFNGQDYQMTIVSHTEPMDIGIYARDDYYFAYQNDAFDQVIADLARASEPDAQNALLAQAQEILAEDAVNAFLFQLAKHGVWRRGVEGLWENSPVQANDLTAVRWVE